MQNKTSLIVTSISGPNEVMRQLAKGCKENGWDFIVIGDEKSPADFSLQNCNFYSIQQQLETGFEFAKKCPTRHYARKNIGYLVALAGGTTVIVETDDDNFPQEGFWDEREKSKKAKMIEGAGWVNMYACFTEVNVWPRGFALEELKRGLPDQKGITAEDMDCPIQQGLADDNPDVDAVYRLVLPLPMKFNREGQFALGQGSVCPFNSQNTTWFEECFELMYLPAYCSFRMTDIWRSFVAQRIAQENGWPVLFHGPTVYQERNEHDLLKDFEDEIPGYLNNKKIWEILSEIELKKGREHNGQNLMACYSSLINEKYVGAEELELIDCWLRDLQKLRKAYR